MTEARWDKVGALFEQVQSVPPEERATFLDERCEDEAVRRKVASLLPVHEQASGFFEDLADAVMACALEDLQRTEERPDPLALEDERVGRYAVEEHLGGGGMGVVYRARDIRLGRPVALKFLPPHLSASEEAEQRFVREARSAAKLDHPNIATIHEISETEQGRRFIAMAYYEGETLKKKIARGPLPVEKALGYAVQVAEGLARAHDAGIVHRDVKPANVMVTGRGDVKLVDFGLARVAGQSQLTQPGTQMGTVAYMSPEQAEGEEVDHRTDLWALGVVLYEMITGERPFRGARDASIVHSILHEEPAPVGEQCGEVPSALERVVVRCLQKDPEERYASAQDLLGDLRAVRSSGGAASVNAGPARRTGTELARRQWIGGVAVAILLVLGATVGWAFWPDGTVQDGASPAGSSSPSVAVLPLETLGQDEPGPFTEGIYGDLLTRLSGVSSLQVIARTSVQRYRGTNKTTGEIARELGVRWVLEGSVQQASGQVQVNVQLIDPQTNTHAWADRYRRELTAANLFAIQGEITREITRALEVELSPKEQEHVGRRPTNDLEAYRLYVQGRNQLARRTESGIRRALDYFQRAIRHDSTYAPAWVGRADALTLRYQYRYEEAERVLPKAEQAARRALELAPTLAEAHASLGLIHEARRQGPQAVRDLQRAAELKPSYAVTHSWLSWVHQILGHPKEALESAKRAVELNPLSPEAVGNLSMSHLINGEPERALAEARRIHKLGFSLGPTPRFYEGLALYEVGRLEEAKSALQDLSVPWADPGPRATLALAHVATGHRAEARALLAEFEDAGHSFAAGLVHAALGKDAAAFDAFRSIEHWDGYWPTLSVHHYYPSVWDALREDPRYDQLIRDVNQSWGLNPDGSLPPDAG